MEGACLQETAHINKSLLMLSNCISALASNGSAGGTAGSFRSSKLTKMLMESLCGTGYTLLLAAISPAERHFDESANTLYFAGKCSNVRRQVAVTLMPHEREVRELKETIKALRRELSEARARPQASPRQGLMPDVVGEVMQQQQKQQGTTVDGIANAEAALVEMQEALLAERERSATLAQENAALKQEARARLRTPNSSPRALASCGGSGSRGGLSSSGGDLGLEQQQQPPPQLLQHQRDQSPAPQAAWR